MIDPEIQVQPNGIELTLKFAEIHDGGGAIAFDNSERKLPRQKNWILIKMSGCIYHRAVIK